MVFELDVELKKMFSSCSRLSNGLTFIFNSKLKDENVDLSSYLGKIKETYAEFGNNGNHDLFAMHFDNRYLSYFNYLINKLVEKEKVDCGIALKAIDRFNLEIELQI